MLHRCRSFSARHGRNTAWLILGIIGLYRVSDIVLGVIANVFYYDLGFSKSDVAVVAKSFGLVMTIVGGFAGGLLSYRYGVLRILSAGRVAVGRHQPAVHADGQWRAGVCPCCTRSSERTTCPLDSPVPPSSRSCPPSPMSGSRRCNTPYSPRLMTLLPKVMGGYSGSMVENLGYAEFFPHHGTLLGIPVILSSYCWRPATWTSRRRPRSNQGPAPVKQGVNYQPSGRD